MKARLAQHLISFTALAVIVGGCKYAYARESLRRADLHAWYRELNAKDFHGQLPDANVSWGGLRKDWLASTQGYEDGSFEIVLDPNKVTSEHEAREVLRHEACHVLTWDEPEAHGSQWRACMDRLDAETRADVKRILFEYLDSEGIPYSVSEIASAAETLRKQAKLFRDSDAKWNGRSGEFTYGGATLLIHPPKTNPVLKPPPQKIELVEHTKKITLHDLLKMSSEEYARALSNPILAAQIEALLTQ